MNFSELGLKENIVRALNSEKIYSPTKIQESAIPQLLGGINAVLHSETGSGKTLAYLLPIYEMQDEVIEKGLQCLIVVPTHELAMQIAGEAKKLSEFSGINMKCEPIIGSVNIARQIEKLRDKPQIIVGTPARVLELIRRKKITAHTVKTAVFDEADKLLDNDGIETVIAIRKTMLRDTQTVFVSATVNENTVAKINAIVDNAVVLKGDEPKIPESIEHIRIICEPRRKIDELRKIASVYEDKKIIVFINRTSDNEVACEKLQFHGYKAECINGATDKEHRKAAINDLKDGRINILVATDIAARGIHINDVEAVVSVSISEEPDDYIHRAGRCGRNGKSGASILLVTEREIGILRKYETRLNIKIVPKILKEGGFSEDKKYRPKNMQYKENRAENRKAQAYRANGRKEPFRAERKLDKKPFSAEKSRENRENRENQKSEMNRESRKAQKRETIQEKIRKYRSEKPRPEKKSFSEFEKELDKISAQIKSKPKRAAEKDFGGRKSVRKKREHK